MKLILSEMFPVAKTAFSLEFKCDKQSVGSPYLFIYLFIYLFDRDNAFKHRYKLAADVLRVEFKANANSQLKSLFGLFHTVAVR